MSVLLKILFVDDRSAGLAELAAGLFSSRHPDLAEAHALPLGGGRTPPLALRALGEAGATFDAARLVRAPSDVGRPFDVVIALSEGARRAFLARSAIGADTQDAWLGGVPALVCWPIPFDAPAGAGSYATVVDALSAETRDLVDRGYLAAIGRERQRMQRFADMMDEGIVIHDDRRRIFFVNGATVEITGLPASEILGRDCHEAFSPTGLCGASCQFCEGPGPVEGRHVYDTTYADRDGVARKLRVTSELLELEPGRGGVLAVIRDLTELTEIKRDLGERRKFHGMVGVSAAVHEVFDAIRAVGSSDYPVLITRESGTGKELVASAIHQESGRSAGPFVPVNCGALPISILESELFGHVRGAFTGAIRDKKGRFELAHGGTLFLDEVGELSPQVQVKLLRVLQEKRIERVGGELTFPVDVRIISATNKDLRALVAKGRFREDLFYRLCVVPIHLPPLRERREDIPYLVDHILARITAESGKQIRGVDDEALELLLAHDWPGNVREQINALQFASIHCDGPVIRADHLPLELRRLRPRPSSAGSELASVRREALDGRFKLTREAVETALKATRGNKVRAAKMLGVGRATLYRFFDRSEDGGSEE